MIRRFLSVIPLVLLVGCASLKYTWNGYDNTLYAYYKNPAEKDRYMEKLKESILKAEQTGNVPPGLYAEYGYMLYEDHGYAEAITYFQKEHDLWPEAKFFMSKMIKNANALLAKTTTKEINP